MDIIFTKEQHWLDKWDKFVSNQNKGSHLVLSDWLKSYNSYGFDFEIGICLQNEKIIGGFGAVIAKKAFFKFYIVPHGPFFLDGFENIISLTIDQLYLRAKLISCCYLQYSLPLLDKSVNKPFSYDSELRDQIERVGNEGTLFKYIYSSYGINWLDFNFTKSADDLLKQFSVQARRNINLAYRNNFKIAYPQTEEDCKIAYSLIEKNAIEGNYSVRNFEDIKKTILNLISKEKAFLITIYIDNEIKGTAFIANCGNYLTYISGGTKKEKPDLNMGYILHWEVIKISYLLGYKGYNISMGGSEGVKDFKRKFMAKPFFFDKPHRHFILRPVVFKIYLFLNRYLKKNKERISTILKKVK